MFFFFYIDENGDVLLLFFFFCRKCNKCLTTEDRMKKGQIGKCLYAENASNRVRTTVGVFLRLSDGMIIIRRACGALGWDPLKVADRNQPSMKERKNVININGRELVATAANQRPSFPRPGRRRSPRPRSSAIIYLVFSTGEHTENAEQQQ